MRRRGAHRGARPFAADKNCGRSWGSARQRERIPLIYYDEQLIAALGVFVCEAAGAGRRTSVAAALGKNHNREEQ
ncbi:hypothetical protein M8494_01065 [Serratia ureilytica]